MPDIDFNFRELEIFSRVVELESFLGLEQGDFFVISFLVPGSLVGGHINLHLSAF